MKSGRSYKQVTFNVPPTSSAREEIGEGRGRRRGRKEAGEGGGEKGGGGRGEMRDHTQLSNLLYSSSSASPGFNELQSAGTNMAPVCRPRVKHLFLSKRNWCRGIFDHFFVSIIQTLHKYIFPPGSKNSRNIYRQSIFVLPEGTSAGIYIET